MCVFFFLTHIQRIEVQAKETNGNSSQPRGEKKKTCKNKLSQPLGVFRKEAYIQHACFHGQAFANQHRRLRLVRPIHVRLLP